MDSGFSRPDGAVTFAVVDVVAGGDDAAADAGTIVVWHVQRDPGESGSRLTGAWRVHLADPGAAAADLANMLTGCAVLPAADAGAVAFAGLPGPVAGVLGAMPVMDPAGTVAAVKDEVNRLRGLAQMEKERREEAKLAKVTAPRFPAVEDLAPAPVPYVGEHRARRALSWARGLEELLETWGEIDAQRRRRTWLGGGRNAPAEWMPYVTADGSRHGAHTG